MKIGFIQDIHGNLEALNAVLSDLYNKHKVEYVFCLGDMINYGPNPNEVLKTIANNNINFIMGEEEYAILYPELFNNNLTELAKNCSLWTRQELSPECYNFIKNNQFNSDGGDNRCIYGEDFLAVHCSIKDILPNQSQYGIYLDNELEAKSNFSILLSNKKKVMFYGHTHIPHIFAYNEFVGKMSSLKVESNIVNINFLPKHNYLINFGSVGFSRDFKPLASYGVLDSENNFFEIHRIPFDIQTTLEKLEKIQAPQKVLSWLVNGGFNINN
jgi:predicted phosphodiesterase